MWCGVAHAAFELHGFGSVRVGKMLPTADNPKLVDMYATEGWHWRDESLFALQLNNELGEPLRLTIQLMGKGHENFQPKLSLAFLTYQITPDSQLNLGRIANPLFSQSDTQYVRYAHDYARLPKAMYWNLEFETIEGISYHYKWVWGDIAVKSRLVAGEFNGKTFKSVVPEGVNAKVHQIVNGSVELSSQHWSLFGGLMHGNADGDALNQQLIYPQIQTALAASGTTLAEQQQLLDAISLSKNAVYYYLGARWQWQHWKIEGERARYGVRDSADPENTATYLAISRRFDPMILTFHHEWNHQDINDLRFISHITQPSLRQIGQQVYQRLAAPNRFRMNVLTLRYDFQPGASFKIDYLHGKDKLATVGTFRGLSLGVDFVF
jgi:hypothetical protein